MINPQFLVGVFESSGKFCIEIIDGLPFFKLVVYHDDYNILTQFKNKFKAGRIIDRHGIKYFIISKNIKLITDFFTKHKLKSKTQSVTFERWRYLYNKIVEESYERSDKIKYRIQRRIKYFTTDTLSDKIFEKEKWKFYNHFLMVSTCGRIYNLKKHLYYESQNETDYLKIKVENKNIKKHQMILSAFKGKQDLLIRHFPDPNYRNCNLWNLHYGTQIDNMNDSILNDSGNNTLTVDEVIKIKNDLLQSKDIKDISNQYNVNPTIIYRIRSGIIWKNIGPDLTNIKFKNKSFKLDKSMIDLIKIDLRNGKTQAEIAKKFNIDQAQISRIKNNKAHI